MILFSGIIITVERGSLAIQGNTSKHEHNLPKLNKYDDLKKSYIGI